MPSPATRSDLLKRRLDGFTRVLPGVEQGDVRALHRARVASRRLRELIPVLQLDHATAKKLARRVRKVTKRLGAVRELDVLMVAIDELHASRPQQSSALAHLGVAVSKHRDRARKKLAVQLPVSDMHRLAEKLERVVDDLRRSEIESSKAAARSWKWAVDSRVVRRSGRLADALREAGTVYLPERLHAVRITLKKLRYALELSDDVNGKRATSELNVLKRAQDLLGRMHDLQVLVDRVRQVQASLAPPDVGAWRDLDTVMASLEDDCRRLHARYMRMRDDLAAIAARSDAAASASVAVHDSARRAG
jgi:CHAD domain-containing protein